jgi:serine/threonine protein kinase
MARKLNREYCTPQAGQRFCVSLVEFKLGGKVGDGATSIVYKATRLDNGQTLAIKFLAPDPKYIEAEVFDDVATRFKREGERGAQLEHPHLIRIISYNENENGSCFENKCPDNPFLLMEFIQGRTLESYIKTVHGRQQGFEINQSRLHLAIQVARAIEDLHKNKLVHRDVKPANIFIAKALQGGFPLVKLGDFGVVKWGDFFSSLSTGAFTATSQQGLGTMKYMSPEQAIRPKEVSGSSDIFSFGITLFELFTGGILASPHHITEIMLARLAKGNTFSRYNSMGFYISNEDEDIASSILDMFLRGAQGRPKISNIRGRLEFAYEQRFESDWKVDLDQKIY